MQLTQCNHGPVFETVAAAYCEIISKMSKRVMRDGIQVRTTKPSVLPALIRFFVSNALTLSRLAMSMYVYYIYEV